MKFKIKAAVDGWHLYTWSNTSVFKDAWDWRLHSCYDYKWQAKRAAKRLATPEEIFEIE